MTNEIPYLGSGLVGTGLVTMADGSLKPLNEVTVGDKVQGPANTLGEVLGVKKVLLGQRQVVMFDNFKLVGAPEVPIWAINTATGLAWWATRDEVLSAVDIQARIGKLLSEKPPYDFTENALPIQYGATDGWRQHESIRADTMPNLELIELLVDNSEAYFVDGYLVTTNANSGSFDWANFKLA